jgi:ubiquinone/menaquinone biosynthesis C-methylase UbiE
MTRVTRLFYLTIACVGFSAAMAAPAAAPANETEAQVLKAEKEFNDAKLRNDTAALERIVAAGYFGLNQWGAWRDKAGLLNLYASGCRTYSFRPGKLKVHLAGDTAIVEGPMTESGQDGRFTYGFLRTYIRQEGRWLLLGDAQTIAADLSKYAGTQAPSTAEEFKADDAHRETNQRATELIAALETSPGDWVADVGAGAGYYSMRLAEKVGSTGKVFAEDISGPALGVAKARIKAFDLQNVELVQGSADDPKLPSDKLAAILIVDSYHHFTNHPAMLEKTLHALKPGGRLVIADYSFQDHRNRDRAEQVKNHEIDPALVRTEVKKAGFRVVKAEDPFVKWTAASDHNRKSDLWMIVAVRPE